MGTSPHIAHRTCLATVVAAIVPQLTTWRTATCRSDGIATASNASEPRAVHLHRLAHLAVTTKTTTSTSATLPTGVMSQSPTVLTTHDAASKRGTGIGRTTAMHHLALAGPDAGLIGSFLERSIPEK